MALYGYVNASRPKTGARQLHGTMSWRGPVISMSLLNDSLIKATPLNYFLDKTKLIQILVPLSGAIKVDFWIFISEIAPCVVTMEINQELWGVSWTHRKFDHVTLDANKKQEQQPNCLSGILCKEAINMCKILINSHVFIKWK